MFINLWPISTLCVADMVHHVAVVICGRYRHFPSLGKICHCHLYTLKLLTV